jgi:hypothetical protein
MNGIWILFVIAFALVGWQLITGEILVKGVPRIRITRESNSTAFGAAIAVPLLVICAAILFFSLRLDLKLGR